MLTKKRFPLRHTKLRPYPENDLQVDVEFSTALSSAHRAVKNALDISS